MAGCQLEVDECHFSVCTSVESDQLGLQQSEAGIIDFEPCGRSRLKGPLRKREVLGGSETSSSAAVMARSARTQLSQAVSTSISTSSRSFRVTSLA